MSDFKLQKTFRDFVLGPEPKNSIIHLNNAGVGPLAFGIREFLKVRLDKYGNDEMAAFFEAWNDLERAYVLIAKLIGAQSKDDVALTQGCSWALSQVAFGRKWKMGSKILSFSGEYPSNAYPWSEAAKRCEVSFVQINAEKKWSDSQEKLIHSIDDNTSCVAISWVQFNSGATSDLKLIADACHRVGAWLVVDGIQGLGALDFDLLESGVDVMCGASHKWMCTPVGLGFAAFAPGRAKELDPLAHGALNHLGLYEPFEASTGPFDDAKRRFQPGVPPLLNGVSFIPMLECFLEIGMTNIEKLALVNANHLREGLLEKGFEVVSPHPKAKSTLVVFSSQKDSPKLIGEKLKACNVTFAEWPIGIRLSPHAFNTIEEMDRVLECL